MRSTIRAMCSKRNELKKQIIEYRSQLSNVCPSVLLRSIHAKIQALNSKFFHHLEQTKKHKLENLTNPRKNRTAPLVDQNHNTVMIYDLLHFTGQDLQLPRGKGHKRTSTSHTKAPHLTHPSFAYESQPQHRDHPTLFE